MSTVEELREQNAELVQTLAGRGVLLSPLDLIKMRLDVVTGFVIAALAPHMNANELLSRPVEKTENALREALETEFETTVNENLTALAEETAHPQLFVPGE